jgi:hypothetical protein
VKYTAKLKMTTTPRISWLMHRSIWSSVNKSAQIYANAYETVEKHIIKEMKLREEIKNA